MTSQESSQERRAFPRMEGNIPVKIYSDDFDFVTETKNLSRSGVYCRVNKYIEPMTKLKIHLLFSFKRDGKITTKKVSCNGVIVRSESVEKGDGFNVAIYFHDIKDRDADCIQDYVRAAGDNR